MHEWRTGRLNSISQSCSLTPPTARASAMREESVPEMECGEMRAQREQH